MSASPPFLPRCISIDLEISARTGQLLKLAAVRADTDKQVIATSRELPAALDQLDALADGARFVLGHNLIAFDLPRLAALRPGLRLLRLPAIDTLRLSPLAVPRNPYHRLVKHYQDGALSHARINDPELDARLALDLFDAQREAFDACQQATPDLAAAYHWLTTLDGNGALDAFFTRAHRKLRLDAATALAAIAARLDGAGCRTTAARWLAELADLGETARLASLDVSDGLRAEPAFARTGWTLAYTLAWLSVAGGNSVLPPWVRHQFPDSAARVRELRDRACADPACDWCGAQFNATRQLAHWFPAMPGFRPEPAAADGRPMQQAIVEAALAGRHVLGVLPTGTGKSVCYQLPALSRHARTGALTLVISPLVALMADQVNGLLARGIASAATLNGMLTLPERAEVLDRVRLGDVSILIVSPEQLRSRTFRRTVAQREIGAWVLDEAHCLSKWGQDFRPDYRYVARFIKESASAEPIPPVLCLTATAKPDVIADIVSHFAAKLGIGLDVFDGGASRDNLEFAVQPTSEATRFAQVLDLLNHDLPPGRDGGAIVYCATRKRCEELTDFLRAQGCDADHFHAGLAPSRKQQVQGAFVGGALRVIAATNAFGMGIDKPDVRLVIHADIPGSLENYLQEAGRAGRDRQAARCVLLYSVEDVERQFGMSARSRLTQREIAAVLRALRRMSARGEARKRGDGGAEAVAGRADAGNRADADTAPDATPPVIATVGELLAFEDRDIFERDDATDDTRLRTALAWLEEAELLLRDENVTEVFPSSLRVTTLDDARQRIDAGCDIVERRRALFAIVTELMQASADEGVSTDRLAGVAGLSTSALRRALHELEALGIASNDTALTAWVHVAVQNASRDRLDRARAAELALIARLREAAPELGKGDSAPLHLRRLCQTLRDRDGIDLAPGALLRTLEALAGDGRDEDDGAARGSISLSRLDSECLALRLNRPWPKVEEIACRRMTAAGVLLDHLVASLPPGSRGNDRLAATTLGQLLAALDADLALKAESKDLQRLLDRALLWLHEQDIVRLNQGLAVFRSAMTLRVERDRSRKFVGADFEPLAQHYREKTLQIHVMAEYVARGLDAMADALRLAFDYFSLPRDGFVQRWLPGREKELERQTTPQAWREIVEELRNAEQQRIVADDREQTNVLVLAGPGAGKTRVLVHRIAWLVRARREPAGSIIALAYNRHAAAEIRRRLRALIGDDALGVTVMTCHALAMRLAGVSLEHCDRSDDERFRDILRRAIALLRGDGQPEGDADESRDRLLAGFRWILVDEYQDIGPEQYELIAALAGRKEQDDDRRLTLFAVGDDDQNIYGFNGASVEFIRRFEADYKARPAHLVENHRSTAHIVPAANAVIAGAAARMKAGHPIRVDRHRKAQAAGGAWAARDAVGQGRVTLLECAAAPTDAQLAAPAAHRSLLALRMQQAAAVDELARLAALDPDWDWSRCAVIARHWKSFDGLRAMCAAAGIAAQLGDEPAPPFWGLRETRHLVARLRAGSAASLPELRDWLGAEPPSVWRDWLGEALDDLAEEVVNALADDTDVAARLPAAHVIEWLADWGRAARRRQRGLLLTTAHGAKGLEFDHVVVLDDGWERGGEGDDADAARRLFYVAMTRARYTLTLLRAGGARAWDAALAAAGDCVLARRAPPSTRAAATRLPEWRLLEPNEVNWGFAGRFEDGAPVHAAIAALRVGDLLTVDVRGERRLLLDAAGNAVGAIASGFDAAREIRAARVGAIAAFSRAQTDERYLARVKCERWEVVVAELLG